jgi:hypothetical protein
VKLLNKKSYLFGEATGLLLNDPLTGNIYLVITLGCMPNWGIDVPPNCTVDIPLQVTKLGKVRKRNPKGVGEETCGESYQKNTERDVQNRSIPWRDHA